VTRKPAASRRRSARSSLVGRIVGDDDLKQEGKKDKVAGP
jgi:hypothetical protein